MKKFVFGAKTVGGNVFSITIVSDDYDAAFKHAKLQADGCAVYPLVTDKGWEHV